MDNISKNVVRGVNIFSVKRNVSLNDIRIEDANNLVYLWSSVENGEEVDLYVQHPFKSPLLDIYYGEEKYLDDASKCAEDQSLDRLHPTGTVLVYRSQIIGSGANGSDHHEKYGCKRKELNIPTGQGYELCEGCHPKNHSEPKAVQSAIDMGNGSKLRSGDTFAYLYGHWWLCESCTKVLIENNISKVVLSKTWVKNFLGL